VATGSSQAPQGVPENAVTRVSDHVYAIIGFPNIALVVGTRATLAVDTGMGPRNGAIVLREAQRLAKGPTLYLTTTHFHPEHAAGESAFPANTILIRPSAQQEEIERRGAEYIDLFSSRSAQNKELLQGVKLRHADVVFDREAKLDLGGVTARLFWLGAAHTKGDELIFVPEDSVLISGDIVQSKLVPNMPNEDASVKGWLSVLDQLELLKPRYVVPDHGALGDGSLIGKERVPCRRSEAGAGAQTPGDFRGGSRQTGANRAQGEVSRLGEHESGSERGPPSVRGSPVGAIPRMTR
jgi:glyoxylase-like metal-dependent hydrolase (beta-lactamase superfamily II)